MEEQLKPFSAFAYIKSDEELEAYVQERISLAVLAERERILSELDGFRSNEKAVNMTGHDVIRDELLDDLAAAIRGQS